MSSLSDSGFGGMRGFTLCLGIVGTWGSGPFMIAV